MQKSKKSKKTMEERQKMNKVTQIAVKGTMDPMQTVMDCLFEKKGEILVSNKILEHIKTAHSYTMMPHENYEVYTFHKRARGTNALFSFLITTGENGNKVSDLECIAELGLMEKHADSTDAAHGAKVYVMLQGEEHL